MDSLRGIRWMHTLRKLPRTRPKRKEKIAIVGKMARMDLRHCLTVEEALESLKDRPTMAEHLAEAEKGEAEARKQADRLLSIRENRHLLKVAGFPRDTLDTWRKNGVPNRAKALTIIAVLDMARRWEDEFFQRLGS